MTFAQQANTILLESSFALLDLSRRARQAATLCELGFVLVNDSRALVAYRQAGLWLATEGVYALSGVVQIEANAAYALWLEQLCAHLAAQAPSGLCAVTADDLPPALAQEWEEWWPAHAVWLALPGAAASGAGQDKAASDAAGLVLVRDLPWTQQEQALLQEWQDISRHAFHALYRPRVSSWRSLRHRVRAHLALKPGQRWWQQRAF